MRYAIRRRPTAALVATLFLLGVVSHSGTRCLAQESQTSAVAHSGNADQGEKLAAVGGVAPKFKGEDSGSLTATDRSGHQLGKCPLKHTAVSAHISGYVARVTVKQVFSNPFKDSIEAIYTFPLSQTGAVDEMLMKIGDRTIRGTIQRREEARKIYESAKSRGQVASLLEQERPNIFTQSVANIQPGKQIEITLQYIDLLPYQSGSFSFAFPTVVGPRFNPGTPTESAGTGSSPDTTEVPDGSKITPPVTRKGTRAGHDISIDVFVDAGIPLGPIDSKSHDVAIERRGQSTAAISLKDKDTIPNKDFVLTWQVADEQLKSGYLAHKDGPSGYFTVLLMPPKAITPDKLSPKEMIFIIDTSGSQSGGPLEKAKETANYAIDRLTPQDTIQVITFNSGCGELFDKPQPANLLSKLQAKVFISALSARGGTIMAPAVERACSIPTDEHRLRIVTLMTDGYIGNDFEILGMVRKLRGNSRWFSFGTGNGVNRFLIDQIASEGGGEAHYVLLNSSGEQVAKEFYDKISSPVLIDIKVDFDGLSVNEVFPTQISDVWAQRPLYFKGRYSKSGRGTVRISGFAAGRPYEQTLAVHLPDIEPANQALAPIWARAKVDRLMCEDWSGAQKGSVNKELKDEIIAVAVEHHIMTQYTSFVAVEEKVVTTDGKSRTVAVPVEMPEGVSYEGVFGTEQTTPASRFSFSPNYWQTQSAGANAGSINISAGGSLSLSTASLPQYQTANVVAGYQGSTVDTSAGNVTAARANIRPSSALLNVRPRSQLLLPQTSVQTVSSNRDKLAKSLRDLVSKYTKQMSKKKLDGLKITDGKIIVQVQLSNWSADTLVKLRKAGLRTAMIAAGANPVVGEIAVENLEELAGLDEVVLVEPVSY